MRRVAVRRRHRSCRQMHHHRRRATLIERSLLVNRPCFFVTAGRRGGGKTTRPAHADQAVTGILPCAAAWSTNEEERRKALLAYFLSGVTYILWDNIPRGTQISCPHIERSCTAAYYADRKLGVSETVCTAASTIHLFTGNNIGPRATWPRAAWRSGSRSTASTPRTGSSSIPTRSAGPRTTGRDPGGALHHPAGQPAAQDATGRRRQDPLQDVVAAGRLGGRARRQAGRARARLPEAVPRQEADDEESASLADVLELMLEKRSWPNRRLRQARWQT